MTSDWHLRIPMIANSRIHPFKSWGANQAQSSTVRRPRWTSFASSRNTTYLRRSSAIWHPLSANTSKAKMAWSIWTKSKGLNVILKSMELALRRFKCKKIDKERQCENPVVWRARRRDRICKAGSSVKFWMKLIQLLEGGINTARRALRACPGRISWPWIFTKNYRF